MVNVDTDGEKRLLRELVLGSIRQCIEYKRDGKMGTFRWYEHLAIYIENIKFLRQIDSEYLATVEFSYPFEMAKAIDLVISGDVFDIPIKKGVLNEDGMPCM